MMTEPQIDHLVKDLFDGIEFTSEPSGLGGFTSSYGEATGS